MDNGRSMDPSDPLVKNALAGQTRVSPVILSHEKLPFFRIATPVKHLGRIRAARVGELDLKHIWNVLERLRIGRSGAERSDRTLW